MAVVDITSHATISQEDRRKRFVHLTLAKLDEHIAVLSLACDSAALHDVDGELTEALYYVHKKLRTDADRLHELV